MEYESWWVWINKANWIALYGNGDNETYFNNFGVKHILKKV